MQMNELYIHVVPQNASLQPQQQQQNQTEPLLHSKIPKEDIFQLQQDTLIVWTELGTGRDLALSFHSSEDCQKIWEDIQQHQKLLHSSYMDLSSDNYPGGNPQQQSWDAAPGGYRHEQPKFTLPPEITLENVDLLSFRILEYSSAIKDTLLEQVINKGYLNSLFDEVFPMAQDLESKESLLACCHFCKSLLEVVGGESIFYEFITSSSFPKEQQSSAPVESFRSVRFEKFVEILTYESKSRGKRTDYLSYLQKNRFKDVFSFLLLPASLAKDQEKKTIMERFITELQQRIHQCFRLEFLKDVVLSPTLLKDESYYSLLSSLVMYYQVDILSDFLISPYNLYNPQGVDNAASGRNRQNEPQAPESVEDTLIFLVCHSLEEMNEMIKDAAAKKPSALEDLIHRRRMLLSFLNEFTTSIRNVSPVMLPKENRAVLYEVFWSCGILQELQYILQNSEDGSPTLKTDEVQVRDIVVNTSEAEKEKRDILSIIINAIDFDSSFFKSFILNQKKVLNELDKNKHTVLDTLTKILLYSLQKKNSSAYVNQICEIFKMLIETQQMYNAGQAAAPSYSGVKDKQNDNDTIDFLCLFYDTQVPKLISYLCRREEEDKETSNDYSVMDIVTFLLNNHANRLKFMLLKDDVLLSLLKKYIGKDNKDKSNIAYCLKLLKTVVNLNDSFYDRYIVKNDLISLVFPFLLNNGKPASYSMIYSQCLNILDYIIVNNRTSLLSYLSQKHHTDLLLALETCRYLKEKYENSVEKKRNSSLITMSTSAGSNSTEAVSRKASVNTHETKRGYGLHAWDNTDPHEEDYFNSDNDDEEVIKIGSIKCSSSPAEAKASALVRKPSSVDNKEPSFTTKLKQSPSEKRSLFHYKSSPMPISPAAKSPITEDVMDTGLSSPNSHMGPHSSRKVPKFKELHIASRVGNIAAISLSRRLSAGSASNPESTEEVTRKKVRRESK